VHMWCTPRSDFGHGPPRLAGRIMMGMVKESMATGKLGRLKTLVSSDRTVVPKGPGEVPQGKPENSSPQPVWRSMDQKDGPCL